jgi:hypothetical protein
MDRTPPPCQEPFWHLLYRYLWPFACFRDVTQGSLIERRQNYRHNRQMGVHLPGFMAKWACLTLVFFLLGLAFEELLEVMLPAACCYVTSTWALTICVQLCVAWLWLRHFPELH